MKYIFVFLISALMFCSCTRKPDMISDKGIVKQITIKNNGAIVFVELLSNHRLEVAHAYGIHDSILNSAKIGDTLLLSYWFESDTYTLYFYLDGFTEKIK